MTVTRQTNKVTSVTKPAWGGLWSQSFKEDLKIASYTAQLCAEFKPPFRYFFFFITIGKRVAYYQIRTGVGCRVGKKCEGTWTKYLLLIFSRRQIPGEGCFLFRREAGKGTWAPAV